MKLFSTYNHPDNFNFIIEDVGDAGVYFFVYNHKAFFDEDIHKDRECTGHIEDHHQDNVEMAKRYAARHWNVPVESWINAKE